MTVHRQDPSGNDCNHWVTTGDTAFEILGLEYDVDDDQGVREAYYARLKERNLEEDARTVEQAYQTLATVDGRNGYRLALDRVDFGENETGIARLLNAEGAPYANLLAAHTKFGSFRVDLPRIIVCGMESEGKSSTLERICMREIFPRGRNFTTRMVIQLHLRNSAHQNQLCISLVKNGEVLGAPMVQISKTALQSEQDFSQIVQEKMQRFILEQHSEIGECVVVEDTEIVVELMSPRVPTIDLVDLPGIVQSPSSLEAATLAITKKYLQQRNTVVLAVASAANSSIRNNSIWRILKENCPTGTPVAVVLTRVDTLSHLDFKEILSNVAEVPYLRDDRTCFVMNRDTRETTPLSIANKAEKEKFQALCQKAGIVFDPTKHGIDAVLSTANQLLETYMRDTWVSENKLSLLGELHKQINKQWELGPDPMVVDSLKNRKGGEMQDFDKSIRVLREVSKALDRIAQSDGTGEEHDMIMRCFNVAIEAFGNGALTAESKGVILNNPWVVLLAPSQFWTNDLSFLENIALDDGQICKPALEWCPILRTFSGVEGYECLILELANALSQICLLRNSPYIKALDSAGGQFQIASMLVSNIDDPDWAISTPLHCAAENGRVDIVNFFVDNQANINAVDKDGYTALHFATWFNHVEIARKLIENNAFVNAKTVMKSTPLHFAAMYGNLEIANLLLENNANVDAQECTDSTPLHFAAKGGHRELVELLVFNHANVEAMDEDGCTPLFFAAREGNESAARRLVQSYANVAATDYSGSTPLHFAAKGGSFALTRFLLENHADVNVVNKTGNTPLHYAAQGGHLDVVKQLIQQSANVDATDEHGYTPLCFAAEEGYLDVAEFLVEKNASFNASGEYAYSPLRCAARAGHVQIMFFLMGRFGVTDHVDSDLLLCAAKRGHIEIAEFLLANNADVNTEDGNDCTPLHFAVKEGHIGMAKLLVENNANVNARDSVFSTPLHLAAWQGNIELVSLLLDTNVNVEAKDSRDSTPLHEAASNGHVLVANLLLKYNANVDSRDNTGRTPLHLAAVYNRVAVTRCLLEYHASVDILDKDYCTPLRYAAWKGHALVVEMLIQNNASVNTVDKDGCTPLDLARQRGNTRVINLLTGVDNTTEIDTNIIL